ncbi:MAG: hypothetical protein ACI9GW_000770 [Halieaceae bacterium]|jgi:hypothetical protein
MANSIRDENYPMTTDGAYIHALRYAWLNPLYEPVVRLSTRESAVQQALIKILPSPAQASYLLLELNSILRVGSELIQGVIESFGCRQ